VSRDSARLAENDARARREKRGPKLAKPLATKSYRQIRWEWSVKTVRWKKLNNMKGRDRGTIGKTVLGRRKYNTRNREKNRKSPPIRRKRHQRSGKEESRKPSEGDCLSVGEKENLGPAGKKKTVKEFFGRGEGGPGWGKGNRTTERFDIRGEGIKNKVLGQGMRESMSLGTSGHQGAGEVGPVQYGGGGKKKGKTVRTKKWRK